MFQNHEMIISRETRWKIDQNSVCFRRAPPHCCCSSNDKAGIQLWDNQNFPTRKKTFRAMLLIDWCSLIDSVKSSVDTPLLPAFELEWNAALHTLSSTADDITKSIGPKSAARFQLNQSQSREMMTNCVQSSSCANFSHHHNHHHCHWKLMASQKSLRYMA